MNKIILITTFLGLARISSAQTDADSLESNPGATHRISKSGTESIDSVRNEFNEKVMRLHVDYQTTISVLDQRSTALQQEIDTLTARHLPIHELNAKIDSLNKIKTGIADDYNSKVAALKAKTLGKLEKIEITPGMEGPMAEVTEKVHAFDLANNNYLKMPDIESASDALPGISPASIVNTSATEITALSRLQSPLDVGNDITDKLGDVSEIENITEGNLKSINQLPNAVQEQVEGIDAVQGLQEERALADSYTGTLTNLNDPEMLKQMAHSLIKKEAINHFAGKETQLQSAFSQIARFKLKYSTVKSLRELPKRAPNSMKGKPFLDRFVPGIYFQLQQKGAIWVDLNPYAGYRISGRFAAGLGWNQRYGYEGGHFVNHPKIFGPRAYFETRLRKGFLIHIEQEAMNTYVPSISTSRPDQSEREWVWSTMMGMKKEYRIAGKVFGTVLLQYNLTNRYFKTPYLDRLNSRIGFEYHLTKITQVDRIDGLKK